MRGRANSGADRQGLRGKAIDSDPKEDIADSKLSNFKRFEDGKLTAMCTEAGSRFERILKFETCPA
jgi:hypothetical protein